MFRSHINPTTNQYESGDYEFYTIVDQDSRPILVRGGVPDALLRIIDAYERAAEADDLEPLELVYPDEVDEIGPIYCRIHRTLVRDDIQQLAFEVEGMGRIE
ncbi:hypothetical protein CCAX7_36130 [Capsulimonas corticalis]|uniref:Uncharacterized protein n=1 Tax=Capsulimonas corticalis TaxID=2219043 RepID=A0A402D712_9BACT|nr:hypothetical protein [Capsulimonas corticalis]BDI31562.1 hypothetical protein CCAX7_36130 [Capsulimonas corticalis]